MIDSYVWPLEPSCASVSLSSFETLMVVISDMVNRKVYVVGTGIQCYARVMVGHANQ